MCDGGTVVNTAAAPKPVRCKIVCNETICYGEF
jgi:hypothetical protein